MHEATVLTPIPASQRIHELDVLRGLALLGIALMNVEYFSASLQDLSEGIAPGARGLDWLADAFVYVFIRGKFWTLFSLLFGMGFAVMLARAQAADRAFMPFYLRRTFGLLGFGLVHMLLIWAGDILVSYALTAFVLLLCFRNTTVPRQWKWGAAIWAVVVALMLLGSMAMIAFGDAARGPDAAARAAEMAAQREAEIAAYSAGSYAEATAVRVHYFLTHLVANVFLVPLVLGMFLIGSWLVRSGAMAQPGEHLRLFRRLAWIAGPLGLALTLASVAIDPNPITTGPQPPPRAMLAMSLHMAGSPLMALALVGIVMLALQRGARWLRALAPAGRMALTHYIGQSVIGTLVFYGYGLGLWGQVSRSGQVLGVLLMFALQVLVSRWWLARFRYGPLEWVWRAFTYWQWPPLRRAA